MQNQISKSPLLVHLITGMILTSLLLGMLVLPHLAARADGGGFPTATPQPTATPTQAAAKSLSESAPLPLPAPTFTSEPLAAPVAAYPAAVNDQSAPQSGAPVPSEGTSTATKTTGTGLSMAIIVGLASLATLFVVGLLLFIRRRKDNVS